MGPLVVDTDAVHGIALLTATASALERDLATTTAASILPVLGAGRSPWPIDQVTLSGPRAVVILTPLGPLSDRGPVLAVAAQPGGSVALLELRCRQAAAEHAPRPDATGEIAAAHDDPDEPGPVRMAAVFTRFPHAADRQRLLDHLSTGRYARAA